MKVRRLSSRPRLTLVAVAALACVGGGFTPISAQPGSVAEADEAIDEVLAQLDMAGGGLALDQIDNLDDLGPNPWLAMTPQQNRKATEAWVKVVQQLPDSSLAPRALPTNGGTPLEFTESEAVDETGLNDTFADGDRLPQDFGSGAFDSGVVTISGSLSGGEVRLPIPNDCTYAEDDGAIPLANATPIDLNNPFALCVGEIGDGPFGQTNGDIDFYSYGEIPAGTEIILDVFHVSRSLLPVNAVIGIYDESGNLLDSIEDAGLPGDDLFLSVVAPTTGQYYGAVAGCCELPADPFDSASGPGVGDVGTYEVFLVAQLPVPPPPDPCVSSEDDGSIPLANAAPGQADGPIFLAECYGEIGDAEQSATTGDIDFFATRPLTAGRTLLADLADIDGNASDAGDLTISFYDDSGTLLASGQDDPSVAGPGSGSPSIEVPADGVYYVAIGGDVAVDPFDPQAGTGNTSVASGYSILYLIDAEPGFLSGAESGAWRPDRAAEISAANDAARSRWEQAKATALGRRAEPVVDTDYFLVHLDKGDALAGGFDDLRTVGIVDPSLLQRSGSEFNPSFAYPEESVLRHDRRNGFDHVATESGWHGVFVTDGIGDYEGELRVVKSGLANDLNWDQQVLFIDFDGATIPGDTFDTGFDAAISPLVDFLPAWGLSPADENAVIDATLDSIMETLDDDLRVVDGRAGNRDATRRGGDFDIIVFNSRDHYDWFGWPNVSRVVVGGTIDELGIPTLGIAQSVDPGNQDTTETAVVLLDLMSAPAGEPVSINSYPVAPGSTKAEFVGFTVGHITAHEIGHLIGNWHQDTFNEVQALMDAGGDFAYIAGVGDDGIFGTADDTDPDFVADVFNPDEGFTGTEDSAGRSAFGLQTGQFGLPSWWPW